MRLSEPTEKHGFFWLPEDAKNQVPGILRISESGEITLEISYVYKPWLRAVKKNRLGHSQSRNRNIERIVGIIDHRLITLDDCFYTYYNNVLGGGGVSTSIIQAQHAFVGVNYDEGKEVTFSKIVFSVEGLDEWLSVSGFQMENNWDENSDLKDASIHFSPPEEIALNLPDGIELKFIFSGAIPFIPAVTEARIAQKAHISLISQELRPIEYFLDLIFKLHNFLRFAINEVVSIDSVTGYSSEITGKLEENKRYEIPIKIYYQGPPYSEEKPKVHQNNMLFSYRDVTNQFEEILTTWIDNYGIHESAFNLYFACKSDSQNYLESNFLFLVQGIEALHRKMSQETQMPEAEFGELVKNILESTPYDKEKWIKEKLKYANELSLRRRIKLMVDPFKCFFDNKKERESFVNTVTNMRNYLTHYDSELETKVSIEVEDLWKLCLKLEALFQLHFLGLIGMDLESIKPIVNENRALRDKLGLEYQEPSENST